MHDRAGGIDRILRTGAGQGRVLPDNDTRNWNALAALMIPEVEFGMSDGDSEPVMTAGRDATLALLKSSVAGARTVHQVHSSEIDLDNNEATVIWAVRDRAVFANGVSITGYGHYTDRWIRQAGKWKVASSRLTHLVTDVYHATA